MTAAPGPDGSKTPLRILLVEDDPVYRRVVVGMLTRGNAGFQVREVEGVKDAVAALRTEAFDCVLLDQFLPDFLGTEFLQVMRSMDVRTPIVMLSGLGTGAMEKEARKLGAKAYLSKAGLTPRALFDAINDVVPSPPRSR